MAPPMQQPKSRSQDHLLSSTPLRKVPSTEAQKNPYPSQWSPPRGVSPQAEPPKQHWRRYELARKGCTPATPAAPSLARESSQNSPTPRATVQSERPLLRDTLWYKKRLALAQRLNDLSAAKLSALNSSPESSSGSQHPAATLVPVLQEPRGDTGGQTFTLSRLPSLVDLFGLPAHDNSWNRRYKLAQSGYTPTSSVAPSQASQGPRDSLSFGLDLRPTSFIAPSCKWRCYEILSFSRTPTSAAPSDSKSIPSSHFFSQASAPTCQSSWPPVQRDDPLEATSTSFCGGTPTTSVAPNEVLKSCRGSQYPGALAEPEEPQPPIQEYALRETLKSRRCAPFLEGNGKAPGYDLVYYALYKTHLPFYLLGLLLSPIQCHPCQFLLGHPRALTWINIYDDTALASVTWPRLPSSPLPYSGPCPLGAEHPVCNQVLYYSLVRYPTGYEPRRAQESASAQAWLATASPSKYARPPTAHACIRRWRCPSSSCLPDARSCLWIRSHVTPIQRCEPVHLPAPACLYPPMMARNSDPLCPGGDMRVWDPGGHTRVRFALFAYQRAGSPNLLSNTRLSRGPALLLVRHNGARRVYAAAAPPRSSPQSVGALTCPADVCLPHNARTTCASVPRESARLAHVTSGKVVLALASVSRGI
ncbi:hypothetical protein GGX14DRAFT_568476 [Mycena pura]|uniref:Uncharacterized protein n=1 Tax=Mycena pura TaxID=153505 RepID=A0AAD6YAN5_9AGAR|nr:hypothetical protein GGX14DRAFT_568476 [Mycena pura]